MRHYIIIIAYDHYCWQKFSGVLLTAPVKKLGALYFWSSIIIHFDEKKKKVHLSLPQYFTFHSHWSVCGGLSQMFKTAFPILVSISV